MPDITEVGWGQLGCWSSDRNLYCASREMADGRTKKACVTRRIEGAFRADGFSEHGGGNGAAISREIHDEVGQYLSALLMEVDNLAATPGTDGVFRERWIGETLGPEKCVSRSS